MADITNLYKSDAVVRSTTNTSQTEITERTISWSDLTTAGFANSDEVFIIWGFTLNSNQITNNSTCDIGIGSTFAGRTSQFPAIPRLESMVAATIRGGAHLGWITEYTLVTNDNIYFSLAMVTSGTASSHNFSCLVLKKSDLDAGDYRYNAVANALAVTTSFQNDATVTLPSASGDDWLILGCGDWSVGSASHNFEQQLEVNGNIRALVSQEGEDTSEQLPVMCVHYYAAAAASAVINFQAREDSTTSFVLDRSRILAIRLEAFTDHIGLYDTTTDSVGGPDSYVETGTVSLSLTATGDVWVIGQSHFNATDSTSDPYMRLQENNTDIVTDMGRGTDHYRDPSTLVGLWTHVVGSMTSGTKTIDMDCAQDTNSGSLGVTERSLVALSLDLVSVEGGASPLLHFKRRRADAGIPFAIIGAVTASMVPISRKKFLKWLSILGLKK